MHIFKVGNSKKGEATRNVAGTVKITDKYEEIKNGEFDNCGSVYVLTAEKTIEIILNEIKILRDEFEGFKKKIEDFVNITYLPSVGESLYPLERKYTLQLEKDLAVALNHNLSVLAPRVSVYDDILSKVDEINYEVFYNNPNNLTFRINNSGTYIIYITAYTE